MPEHLPSIICAHWASRDGIDKVAVEVTDEMHIVGEGRPDWNRSCWEKNCEETDYYEVFHHRILAQLLSEEHSQSPR
jgi:hypothetical protein